MLHVIGFLIVGFIWMFLAGLTAIRMKMLCILSLIISVFFFLLSILWSYAGYQKNAGLQTQIVYEQLPVPSNYVFLKNQDGRKAVYILDLKKEFCVDKLPVKFIVTSDKSRTCPYQVMEVVEK